MYNNGLLWGGRHPLLNHKINQAFLILLVPIKKWGLDMRLRSSFQSVSHHNLGCIDVSCSQVTSSWWCATIPLMQEVMVCVHGLIYTKAVENLLCHGTQSKPSSAANKPAYEFRRSTCIWMTLCVIHVLNRSPNFMCKITMAIYPIPLIDS